MAAASDALIEGIAGAIGACISLTATYPLLTVSTLRALELRDDKEGSPTLASKLRAVPGPIRDVIQVRQAPRGLYHSLSRSVLSNPHGVTSMLPPPPDVVKLPTWNNQLNIAAQAWVGGRSLQRPLKHSSRQHGLPDAVLACCK